MLKRTIANLSGLSIEQAEAMRDVLKGKRLAPINEAFEITRSQSARGCRGGVDLHVRPIRHRLEARVKAHIFLSLLAYYVQWHIVEASMRSMAPP